MSKWKSNSIKIIQAFQGHYHGDIYGLGDDQMIYKWDQSEGAWKKYWSEYDAPGKE